MKKKLLVIALILLIAGAGAVGVYAYLKYQVAYEGVITGDCAAPITLYRSSEGFPIADVADESDALYALGFLHAQDRLPVLEYYRSLINPEGVPMIADAEDAERVRLLLGVCGVRAAAETALAGINPDDRARLARYVAGINLYRARYSYKERLAQQYLSAAWTVQDVLGIFNVMEFSSALSGSAEMVFSCREKNDRVLADILPENRRIIYGEEDARAVSMLRKYAQALQRYTGLYLAGTGYLTGQDSGLAGLKLTSSPRLFPKWYPVSFRINGKRRDIATIAGLPFAYHIRGESRYYSLFTAPADTVDFVRVSLSSDASGVRYRSGVLAGSVSELKDSSGRVYARGTEAGVLVSDIFGDKGDSAVAMNYRHPDAAAISFLLSLMSADVRAADIRPGMVLNPKVMLYHDSSGRGVAAFGAATQMNASRRFIGEAAQPGGGTFALREPVSGVAVITSDYWPWTNAPFRITRSSRARYELVRREIAGGNGVNDLMRISFGSSSEFAQRMVPYVESMTAKLPVTSAKLTRLYFSEWDQRYEHSAVAPALFQTLLSEYFTALLSDEIGDDADGLFPILDEVMPWYTDAVQRGVSPLFDDTTTDDIREDRDSLYDRVFITTLRRMHRNFGPRIEKWTLDAVTEKGETPLIDAEELGRVRVFTPDGDATSFNQTIYSPEADGRIGVTAFTAMSAIFSDALLVSADYPVSVRLFSRYNATKHGIYGTVQPADAEHRMSIQPGEAE